MNANSVALQTSRVYYNYLHLSMQEDHYNFGSNEQLVPSFRTVNSYQISEDFHAQSTTYNLPVQVDQMRYCQSDFQLHRRATSTYDQYGCPLTIKEAMWDPNKNDLVLQKSITSTYGPSSWGGQLLASESFVDQVSGHEKYIAYETDGLSITKSTVTYRNDSTAAFLPWKQKSYNYDEAGRLTAESIMWSPEVDFPTGSVSQYTIQKAYDFNAKTSTYTETTTDPLGQASSMSYAMQIKGGPLVQKVSAMGSRETFAYDLLGRIVETTDALGSTTETSYSVGQDKNFQQTVTSMGYVTLRTYDILGRATEVADSGNQTSSAANRKLSQIEYDSVSRVVQTTNELGLSTTQAYDALSRLTQNQDLYGNVTTYEYDESELTMVVKINGDVRKKAFFDCLGRQVRTETYGDSSVTNDYIVVSEYVYDGFDKHVSSKQLQQSLNNSTSTLLEQRDTSYDVEGKPDSILSSALPSTLADATDQVLREAKYDIFGNAVTYNKTVTYADGRQFVRSGPLSIFDAANRMVRFENQLGQVEVNDFDADGRLVAMTRYDGTKVEYAYDNLGQLLSTIDPDNTTSYTYLPDGRLASITRARATLQYAYAADGSIQSTQYPDGRKQTYVLDDFSRIIREVDAAGRTTENSFDASGRLVSKLLGNSKVVYELGTVNHTSGLLVSMSMSGTQPYRRNVSYDGFGRQTRTTDLDQNEKVIMDALSHYDSRGRLLAREISSETYPQAPSVNKKEQFGYDGLGQLVSHSTAYDQDLAPAQVEQFVYDGNFNILQKVTNGVSNVLTYNLLDQRQDEGFVYDVNGRLLHDADGRNYVYSADDRLLSVTGPATTTYSYNPDDSLASRSKTAGATSFYYSCGAVASSLDVAGGQSTWSSYLLQPGGRMAAETDGKETVYFLQSGNSVSMALNGGSSSTYDYQAYGEVAATGDNIPFAWQQELNDADNGLTYLRSRYYQANNMAFITMDGYRDQENRYAYCNGDPINGSDGTGHAFDKVMAGIAGAAVGLAVTVLSGGALTGLGIGITAASLTTIGVGAAAVSGALGSLAGDATSAVLQHLAFTAARAGTDLLVGAIGGAVGAGSGGLASSAAMRMALSSNFSRMAIVRIGAATSSVVGGSLGGLAAAGASALLNHEPLFSASTAFSALLGAVTGGLGAYISGGAILAKGSLRVIPVELTEAEAHLVVPAALPTLLDRYRFRGQIYAMSTRPEMARDLNGATQANVYGTGARTGVRNIALIAHGDAGRLYARVNYGGEEVYRPIDARLLARLVQQNPNYTFRLRADGILPAIKLISCHGGWSNAQRIANVLQRQVWAAYGIVSVKGVHDWHLFNPAPR